ncbi:MAG TPA: hypothetical protein PLR25_18220, partial [Planctomycetaceae bacterium]|nr:hypothetical protein [Planctomycetaceae bacterium]
PSNTTRLWYGADRALHFAKNHSPSMFLGENRVWLRWDDATLLCFISDLTPRPVIGQSHWARTAALQTGL